MKKTNWYIWFFLLVVSILLFGSCSSMAGRYIGYRLSPDRVKTKGSFDIDVAQALSGPVTIYLDDYAVPHIRAENEEDLFYALGYMQGRDRRFQLEMFKMLGYGRLRELVGDRDKTGILKQTEIVSRMLGFYEDAEKLLEEASKADIVLLEAFASGINEATRREPVPMEFRILDYEPEPWKPEDSMVIFAMISFGLCKNWEHELGRLELALHQLRIGQGVERAMKIYKPLYQWPPYLITNRSPVHNGLSNSGKDFTIPLISPELVEYLEEFVNENPNPDNRRPVPEAALSNRGMDNWYKGNSASNNWAVDGDWTGTGRAALATDSHMPHMLPSMGYLFHLDLQKGGTISGKVKSHDYSIIGAGFAGLPAVAFGTNGNVAWGATSNWADVTDLYVEKAASNDPNSYIIEGNSVPFIKRTEVFKIRSDDGSYREESYTVRETVHGVILNDFTERIKENFPLIALRRNRLLGSPLSALRNVYMAESVREAKEAFITFYSFTGHWALADDKGDVGYVGSVRLPYRENHLGTLPVPGWIDKYEWRDFVDPDELPVLMNPSNGFLGTANNQVIDPFAADYPINFDGSTPFRYQRIKNVLGEGRRNDSVVDIMSDLQMDDKFMGWELLRPEVTAALGPILNYTGGTEDRLIMKKAAEELIAWDGRNLDHLIGPTIFNIFQIQAFRKAMKDEVTPKTLHFYLSFYNLEPFVYDLLSDPRNPAWDNVATTRRERYADVLRSAFKNTVEICIDRYGKKIENWKWENGARFVLEHPFGTEKALAGFLNRGPLPIQGATDTLFAHQIQRSEIDHFDIKGGPVLRVVVDFGNWNGSFMSIPGGESGRPVSGHYDDILPLYLQGKGVPLETDFSTLFVTARGRILLH